WGILQGQMVFFYIVTIFVIIGLVYYMEKYARNNKLTAVSLSLILGGAIGNFIDRLLRQEVVDFLDVMIFKYDFPIFNVADSCLVIGVILIFIATIMEEKSKGQEKA
ncbi:MAG TPA: signal peptidase II, partial [Candidatus Dormibacteraeota bacterium]|nr:signal peptidase II [Candidatus Dormibacteraeota bacterium]